MNKLVLSILVALIAFSSQVLAQESQFGLAQVRKDTVEYINTVFGAKPPTLSDYYRFGGVGAEEEVALEMQECRKLFPKDDPENSDKCSQYEALRMTNKNNVDSLYFKLLRTKLKVHASSIRILKIYSLSSKDAYRIDLEVTGSGMHLTLGHAKDKNLADLGLIGLIEVNGKKTNKFLGLN